MAFPSAVGQTGFAKQHARDFAIGRIGKPSVERAQRQDSTIHDPGALRIGPGLRPAQSTPEPGRGGRPIFEELVERQKDCERFDAALVDVDMKRGCRGLDEVFGAIHPSAGIEKERRKLVA